MIPGWGTKISTCCMARPEKKNQKTPQLKITHKDKQFIFMPSTELRPGRQHHSLNYLLNEGRNHLVKQRQICRSLDSLSRAVYSFWLFCLTPKTKRQILMSKFIVWHDLSPNLWPIYNLFRAASPSILPFEPCSLVNAMTHVAQATERC